MGEIVTEVSISLQKIYDEFANIAKHLEQRSADIEHDVCELQQVTAENVERIEELEAETEGEEDETDTE